MRLKRDRGWGVVMFCHRDTRCSGTDRTVTDTDIQHTLVCLLKYILWLWLLLLFEKVYQKNEQRLLCLSFSLFIYNYNLSIIDESCIYRLAVWSILQNKYWYVYVVVPTGRSFFSGSCGTWHSSFSLSLSLSLSHYNWEEDPWCWYPFFPESV